MHQIIKWYRGYLRIKLKGYNQERFINICASHGIELSNLRFSSDGYLCSINYDDYTSLRPIVRKCGVIPYIKKRHGFPFIKSVIVKNISLIISFIMCFILIMILSGYLWNIEYEGNTKYTNEILSKHLSEIGVYTGAKLKDINCPEIESSLRIRYNDIGWVSAQIKGTGLIIRINESIEPDIMNSKDDKACDIIAVTDGVVKSIITRKGKALVKAGDSVKKGDTLISGSIEIIGDNLEPIGYMSVKADGDITICYEIIYKNKISREQIVKKYTGKKKNGYKIYLFNDKIFSYNSSNPYNTCDIISTVKSVELFNNFYIPVRYEEYSFYEYNDAVIRYSNRELEEKLKSLYDRYKRSLIRKNNSIIKEKTKIKYDSKYAVLEGSIITEAPMWKSKRINKEIGMEDLINNGSN